VKISATHIEGVLVIEPEVFGDERGFFMETWRADAFTAAGIAGPFVQDNHSGSTVGILRGLHFQSPRAQGKLVRVASGAVFDVVVGHCQSKFYSAFWRPSAGWGATVFAQESQTRSMGFDTRKRLYSFALTVPMEEFTPWGPILGPGWTRAPWPASF
jgi:hypothetical protein